MSTVIAVVPADLMVSAVAEGLVIVGTVNVPVNVGEADKTVLPVPVLVVTPVPPFATANVPATVTAPVVAVEGVRPVEPKLMDVTPPLAAQDGTPDATVSTCPVEPMPNFDRVLVADA